MTTTATTDADHASIAGESRLIEKPRSWRTTGRSERDLVGGFFAFSLLTTMVLR